MIDILLQTTIAPDANDWAIDRFSLLRDFLACSTGADGQPLFRVTARDRLPIGRPDPVLSTLAQSSFDELWLFAVDVGDGLTPEDCEGITQFRKRGSGLLVTRDHMDLGSSLCTIGAGIGAAHHFHSKNADPDETRRRNDDPYTTSIQWPNYHSGANGDFQRVIPVGDIHPVLRDPLAPDGRIHYLPAHPHEGSVGAPADDPSARVILESRSVATGNRFNLAVAFEPHAQAGAAIAQSTFHHFCDYNWDVALGAPSFVTEPPGAGMRESPQALRATQRYMRNVALWLAGRPTGE
jgi:hypothetical protein